MTIRDQLEKLEFHDSFIKSVDFVFSPRPACTLKIDYYNWEMTNRAIASLPQDENIHAIPSEWKHLVIKFGFMAHIEYSEPDLINSIGSINCLTLDYGLEKFKKEYAATKQQFPLCKYPILEPGMETISIKFETHSNGYVWVVGSGVSLEWIEDDAHQEDGRSDSKFT